MVHTELGKPLTTPQFLSALLLCQRVLRRRPRPFSCDPPRQGVSLFLALGCKGFAFAGLYPRGSKNYANEVKDAGTITLFDLMVCYRKIVNNVL